MMFARLLWRLLRGSRGRLSVALIALVSGAAVISALLNLDLDIERKLTQEFRTLGANFVIGPRGAAETLDAGRAAPALAGEAAVLSSIEQARSPDLVSFAPYLFIVARAAGRPVVVTGTWLDEAKRLEPWWKISGEAIVSRDDRVRCLVGRNVARQFGVGPGSRVELSLLDRKVSLTVAGIVDAGGTEDNQMFVNLPVAQQLGGLEGRIGLVEMSVSGNATALAEYAEKLAAAVPGLEVRPAREVTEAEGELLNRIRLLIFAMVVLILVLTALCVLATMAALAMERREDVGLMKALGGSITRVVGLFLAETGLLGAAGGFLGCLAGFALSHWMGQRVFGTAISARWEILPLTVAVMVGVALTGALPLRLLGKVKPAVILRGK